MSLKADSQLVKELKKFGAGNWNDCFHCGNCTATCPLSENSALFPRKRIRYIQLGLKEKLAQSPEPWLCYYCGDCSKECPREANPGELMMTLRRYLTAAYDWTGLSYKFYTSKTLELTAIIFIGMLIILAFIFSGTPMELTLNEDGGVRLNSFAPVNWIEIGDWLMAGILIFFLSSNIFNMYLKIIIKDKSIKVPFSVYIKEAYSLILHFCSQLRFNKCDSKPYWLTHLFLVSGYISMFTMIVVFLPWFQTDVVHPIYHPQRFIGYYATIALFTGLIFFIISRIKKNRENSKFTHYTDWTFLILLFLTTLTGILVHIFRINGMAMATYYTYVAHLAVIVPMFVVEVPFSKWSHLAYRPFAIYFFNLRKAAVNNQNYSNK